MRRGVLVAVFVLLTVVSAGVLFIGGLSPGAMPGPGEGDGTVTTTNSSIDGQSDDRPGSSTTTAAPSTDASDSQYDVTIEKIEECGSTCRDVTASLANTGMEARQNVRVTTKVSADGDLLWTGNETVGTLAPDQSHVSTKRVNVGLAGAMKIQSNDGYVTIVTVVRSDSGTVRFEDRRKVA